MLPVLHPAEPSSRMGFYIELGQPARDKQTTSSDRNDEGGSEGSRNEKKEVRTVSGREGGSDRLRLWSTVTTASSIVMV